MYVYNITSKGQITIPKVYREMFGLDKASQASISLNDRGELTISRPKTLEEVRKMLNSPTHKDPLSEKEAMIGKYLRKKYDIS